MDIDIATSQPTQKATALAPPYLTTFGMHKEEEEKKTVAVPAPTIVVLEQRMMN